MCRYGVYSINDCSGLPGVKIAILLVALDELYHREWVSGWGSELLKEAVYNAVKMALDTLAEYKIR